MPQSISTTQGGLHGLVWFRALVFRFFFCLLSFCWLVLIFKVYFEREGVSSTGRDRERKRKK